MMFGIKSIVAGRDHNFVWDVSSFASYLKRKIEKCLLVNMFCDCPSTFQKFERVCLKPHICKYYLTVLFQFHSTHTGHCYLLTIVKGLYCGYRLDCGAIEAFQFPRITTIPAQEEKSLFKSVYPSRVNIWECYIGSHRTTTRRRRTQDTQSPQPPSAAKGETRKNELNGRHNNVVIPCVCVSPMLSPKRLSGTTTS